MAALVAASSWLAPGVWRSDRASAGGAVGSVRLAARAVEPNTICRRVRLKPGLMANHPWQVTGPETGTPTWLSRTVNE